MKALSKLHINSIVNLPVDKREFNIFASPLLKIESYGDVYSTTHPTGIPAEQLAPVSSPNIDIVFPEA